MSRIRGDGRWKLKRELDKGKLEEGKRGVMRWKKARSSWLSTPTKCSSGKVNGGRMTGHTQLTPWNLSMPT